METVPSDDRSSQTRRAGRQLVDADRAGQAGARVRTIRRFGLTGTLLMALGSLGAGALPVPNPLFGLRVLGLPIRNVTLAMAVTYAGIGMLVLAWLWLGRAIRRARLAGDALPAGPVIRGAATWALPLALCPPLFSTDVYTYLGQEAISARGLDPYLLGPAQALGVDDPLVRSIPTIWQNTPAPYGPLFLWIGRILTPVAQDGGLLLGVIAHRLLALAGIALIGWALLRLGRRFGADPAVVMWLGIANPLVLFHLVSGVHNEALMLGLMLAGLEIGLSRSWLFGAVLITAAAMVKLPAALALGFLGVHLARRWAAQRGAQAERASARPGTPPVPQVRDVAAAAGLLGAVAVTVTVAIARGSGLGFGFLGTLGGPNAYRSLLSLTTTLGRLSGQLGIVAGLGDHFDAVIGVTRSAGGLIGAAVCALLLLAVLRGRLDPLAGLGAGLGAAVLLAPVVHPWYLLWAVLPLAATPALPRCRVAAVAACAVTAVLVPPTGADFNFRPYQLPMAILAGAVILLLAVLVIRRPWTWVRTPEQPALEPVAPG